MYQQRAIEVFLGRYERNKEAFQAVSNEISFDADKGT